MPGMDQGNKNSFIVQDALICIVICAPLVLSGYAAHAYGLGWLIIAILWCAMLYMFFRYCPDDEDDL